jgi:ADP-heptose:LPS heptosyltransferase
MGNGWTAVARFGGIGDNLIVSSVLPLLSRTSKIEVLTQSPHGVVFENNPYISKLTIKDRGDIPGEVNAWQEWFVSRAKEYDVLLNFSHSCEGLLALFTSQTSFWWPDEFRRKLCGRSYLEVVHEIAGVPFEFNPRFYPTDAEKEKAADTKKVMGERVIGWCLSGTRIDKIYPHAPMAIARIIKELNVPVMMTGASGRDFEMAKIIMDIVGRHNSTTDGLHLALSPDGEKPSWPIRRTLTQLHACDLVITPDTGPAWAVAMEDMPKVVLLSHASAENITKHWRNTVTLAADPKRVPCWPCHKLHDTRDTCVPNSDNTGAACISDISVEAIVTTARRSLTPNE